MTRLLRLGLFHCTGNLGGPNFVIRSWRYLIVVCCHYDRIWPMTLIIITKIIVNQHQEVAHPFPLLLPLCKWCHLLFFSVLVVDRLSIKNVWSWCCKQMKMYNMVKRKKWRKNNGSLTTSATASTIGNIMAVVAVLEIHMERNIVVNMKPNIKRACKQGKLSCLDKDPGFY